MKYFAIALLLLETSCCPSIVFAGVPSCASKQINLERQESEGLTMEKTYKSLVLSVEKVLKTNDSVGNKTALLSELERSFKAKVERVDFDAMTKIEILSTIFYEEFRKHKIKDQLTDKFSERCWYPVSILPEHERYSPSVEWEDRKDAAYTSAEDLVGLNRSANITRKLEALVHKFVGNERSEKILAVIENAADLGRNRNSGLKEYSDFAYSLIESFDLVGSFEACTIAEDIDLAVKPAMVFINVAESMGIDSSESVEKRSEIARSLSEELTESEIESLLKQSMAINSISR